MILLLSTEQLHTKWKMTRLGMKVVPRFSPFVWVAFFFVCRCSLNFSKEDQRCEPIEMKQKFRLGGERFDIKRWVEIARMQVEDPFLDSPDFTIYDEVKNGEKVITKKQSAFFKFVVELINGDPFISIKKRSDLQRQIKSKIWGFLEGNIWDTDSRCSMIRIRSSGETLSSNTLLIK